MKDQNFNIGDKVIALTNPLDQYCQPRKKGNKYIINGLLYCCKCGHQMINIGKKINRTIMNDTIECFCGNTQNADGNFWTSNKHFIKADNIDQAIEQCVEVEDYEFASVLRDLNR